MTTDKHQPPKWGITQWTKPQSAPESAVTERHGEAMQRHFNRTAKHSERVHHGGNPGAGEKIR